MTQGSLQCWDSVAGGGMGLGSQLRSRGLPAASPASARPSRLEGKGPYLFGVVPREDAIPVELLQDILELLGGVWGDKDIALSRASAGSPLPPDRWQQVSLLIHDFWNPGPLPAWAGATYAALFSLLEGRSVLGGCPAA